MKTKVYFGYIYIIRNTINNKVYIGQTRRKPGLRWKQHCKERNCPKLKAAFKKYGVDNFYEDKNKLYCCVSTSLNKLCQLLDYYETFYITKYNSVENGYNCNYGGNNPIKSELDLKYGIRSDDPEYSKVRYQNRSEEEKQRHRDMSKRQWHNKTDIEKKEYNKRRKKQRANYSEEHKERIHESQRKYRANMSQEKKEALLQRRRELRKLKSKQ